MSKGRDSLQPLVSPQQRKKDQKMQMFKRTVSMFSPDNESSNYHSMRNTLNGTNMGKPEEFKIWDDE